MGSWGSGDTLTTAPIGPGGPPNVLTITAVYTLAPGQPAYATISGTSPNQTLVLGIPAGGIGATGANGLDGRSIVGLTGPAGSGTQSVGLGSVTISGLVYNVSTALYDDTSFQIGAFLDTNAGFHTNDLFVHGTISGPKELPLRVPLQTFNGTDLFFVIPDGNERPAFGVSTACVPYSSAGGVWAPLPTKDWDVGTNSDALQSHALHNAHGTVVINRATYTGQTPVALYDGCQWISDVNSAGTSCKIQVDRAGKLTVALVIGGGGMTWAAGAFDGVARIIPFFGHSQDAGSPDNTSGPTSDGLLSKSAVDTGVAVMLTSPDAYVHPSSLRRQYGTSGATQDLLNTTAYSGSTESPTTGFAKGIGILEAARGAKNFTIYGNASHSGAYIADLLRYDFNDLESWLRYAIFAAKAAGKTPMPSPLLILGHGNSELLGTHDYLDRLLQLQERYARCCRKLFGMAPNAPDLPIIITAPAAEGALMRAGGSRVYDPAVTSTAWAGYVAAHKYKGRIISAGPIYQHPVWTDYTHLNSYGMYRQGEQVARCFDALSWGPAWEPLMPVEAGVTSNTTIQIRISKITLALDTTRVANMLDGWNGFTVWSKQDAISAPSSTVTITIASPGVVTWTGHSLVANTPVRLSTTNALPTGLTASVTYYVVNPATNTFQLAATPGGAAINTSGSQAGTHTAARFAEIALASVALGGASNDTITITTGAAMSATDTIYVEYASRMDDAFVGTGNISPGSPGGPRGNVRTQAGWTSQAPGGGGPTDYDWMIPFRIPLRPGRQGLYRTNGDIA